MLIVHHVFLKSYGIISRKTNTIIKFMCVGAMDGRCQIDIASVVSAHIVFYILHQGLTISLLDVGQGQCLVLAGETETAVVDCGSTGSQAANRLKQALTQQGRQRIDHLILTHYDRDHTGGAAQLLLEGRVGCLWLPQPLSEDEAGAAQLAALAELMEVPVEPWCPAISTSI